MNDLLHTADPAKHREEVSRSSQAGQTGLMLMGALIGIIIGATCGLVAWSRPLPRWWWLMVVFTICLEGDARDRDGQRYGNRLLKQ
jgi:hypothetical protein